MEPVSVSWIVEATDGVLLCGDPSRMISGISIDSRTISKDELFIALRGERFDGHSFIIDVIKRGAAGAIIQSEIEVNDIAMIRVKDTLKALGDIAKAYRERFDPKVVAISGSNGKTTTKEMVGYLLQRRFNTLKAMASFNNFVGVPLTLFGIEKGVQVVVLEMETNLLGGIRRLCEIARPSIAIITNISDTHLESLKTREGVFMEKLELLDSLPKDGVAVLNADDPFIERMKRKGCITYGIMKKADFNASCIKRDTSSISFLLNNEYRVELNTFFYCNVYNALGAIAGSNVLGLDIGEAVEGLSKFRFPKMRMEMVTLGDLRIINDAYNANPKSMEEALHTLKEMEGKRRVAILGDMLELGDKGEAFHYEIGRISTHCKIDVLVTIGGLASYISRGAKDSGMDEDRIFTYNTKEEALRDIPYIIRGGDTILVKGSRRMRLEEIVDWIENKTQVLHF